MKKDKAVAFQILRAEIDEWEYKKEQIEKGLGIYVDLDPETKKQILQTVDNFIDFLRKEMAA